MEELPEPRPPWVVFPDQHPTDPMTQGAQEVVKDAWCAFWAELDPDERADYLDRWDAPPGWRSTIETWFAMTPEELAEDARESEEALARRRAEDPPRRTWA